MKIQTTAAALAAAATLLFGTAASCDVAEQRQPEQIELPLERPDCDTGDLYGKTPDPDCGGLWFGGSRSPGARPSPAVVRTTRAPAAPPRPVTPTRRR